MKRLDPETVIQAMIDACAERDQPIHRTDSTAYVNVDTKVEFECGRCGQLCSPLYYNVVKKKQGPCRTCGGSAPLDPETAIQAMIDACAERDQPIHRTEGTTFLDARSKVEFECGRCGQLCYPVHYSVIGNGQGPCRTCSGSAPLDPETAIQAMIDACAERDQPIHRTEGTTFLDARSKVEFECGRCGQLCYPVYGRIVNNDRGPCWSCIGGAPHHPETAIQAMIDACAERDQPIHRTDSTAYVNVDTKVEFECGRCGQLCYLVYDKIVNNSQGPCSSCADYGFDYNAPTMLYLLVHSDLGLAKIGIANEGSRRIEWFAERGFECLDVIRYDTGREAEDIEQTLHKFLRAKGCQPDRKRDDTFASRVEEAIGHLMGHTEVFEFGSFDFNDLTTLIDAAA